MHTNDYDRYIKKYVYDTRNRRMRLLLVLSVLVVAVESQYYCAGYWMPGVGTMNRYLIYQNGCNPCNQFCMPDPNPLENRIITCQNAWSCYSTNGYYSCTWETRTLCSDWQLCKICHPNATTFGICAHNAIADNIVCTCNDGFQGDGIICELY